mgnify:CR=1 FL=1
MLRTVQFIADGRQRGLDRREARSLPPGAAPCLCSKDDSASPLTPGAAVADWLATIPPPSVITTDPSSAPRPKYFADNWYS